MNDHLLLGYHSGNSVLVDGGVVNNIPTNNAIRTPDDILIAVNVNADIPLMAATIIKNISPDILVEISKKTCGTFDFYKAEEQVEVGRYAAKEQLDSLQL